MRKRLRTHIANLFDHLPGTCWTALGMYSLGYRRHPLQWQDALCRRDAAENGQCMCTKLRSDSGQPATGGQA